MEMMQQKIHEGVGLQNSQLDSLLDGFIQGKEIMELNNMQKAHLPPVSSEHEYV